MSLLGPYEQMVSSFISLAKSDLLLGLLSSPMMIDMYGNCSSEFLTCLLIRKGKQVTTTTAVSPNTRRCPQLLSIHPSPYFVS